MPVDKVRPQVFLEISWAGGRIGRIVIELFSDITPKTAENFRKLCTGESGNGAAGSPLHYKNCKFHRVIRGFMVQGGDITLGNGMGGESIYGETFEDENFREKHNKAGAVSMANAGPDTNASQFFISTVPLPHLDGHHVVFGQVVEGMEVVMRMQDVSTNAEDEPVNPILIVDCGEV